jgi:flagellar motility protein MotE (MotC chaperone)
LLLVVFFGVAAYALRQKGLLTRETFDLLSTSLPGLRDSEMPVAEMPGLNGSILKKERKLGEESKRLERLAARLEMQREEFEAERALIEEQLKALEPAPEPEPEPVPEPGPSEELVKLAKLYEGMPPDEAAAILENLPNETVARIIPLMRRRSAAMIMESMDPGKAAEVSTLLISEQDEVSG